MTWAMRPIWSVTAASSAGFRYPWIAAHHEDMASIGVRPSANSNRTPCAPVTTPNGTEPTFA